MQYVVDYVQEDSPLGTEMSMHSQNHKHNCEIHYKRTILPNDPPPSFASPSWMTWNTFQDPPLVKTTARDLHVF